MLVFPSYVNWFIPSMEFLMDWRGFGVVVVVVVEVDVVITWVVLEVVDIEGVVVGDEPPKQPLAIPIRMIREIASRVFFILSPPFHFSCINLNLLGAKVIVGVVLALRG